MSFSIGIVGLPNVGKSTLFTALTKKQVDAANYPFCTIDPNVGTVPVPDERLGKLAAVYNSAKVIPTVIEFVDIAGLVAGAHKGEGLGNKFLSHIREVDAICQVVREFSDANVIHVGGRVDPESDKQIINTELIFADLATVEQRLHDVQPKARSGDKEAVAQLATLQKVQQLLDGGTVLSQAGLTDDERMVLRDLHLLTLKPMLYVLNVAENEVTKSSPGQLVISAKLESELVGMPEVEAREYLNSVGMKETGLDRLIRAAYDLLGLITFFTAGPTETRAWTIPRGATAPQAGSAIHTDFEEKFIRAEVTPWQDIVECGGEVKAKELGKVRTEGKEYVVQDGDTIYFRI
ncbi:MAG: redox-regulated ATPase YchF [Candidatus Kerfeldbacteria bacterium]|nr:redox-regulated ATPase YchF [Candidatus Kerfeldbacteria bacterium]